MSVWTEPSPSDFDRWEQELLTGAEPSTAAKNLGFTSSAFRRADHERHADALAMSRETRAHFADERVERWALDDDADTSMRLAWAKRWQPEYAGVQRVEHDVNVHGQVTVGVSLADILAAPSFKGGKPVYGIDSQARPALPDADQVLPQPDVDQRDAGEVPPPRRT